MPRVAAVLFDLDGTLVDSAPDLAGTANDMRVQRGLPPLPYDSLRPHAGSGALGRDHGSDARSDLWPIEKKAFWRVALGPDAFRTGASHFPG